MLQLFIALSLFIHSFAIAAQPSIAEHYLPNKYISAEVWQEVEPYLLPPDHPLKEKLDELFSKERIVTDSESILKAGFEYPASPGLHIQAVKHPLLKGYYIKMHLDSIESDTPFEEWKKLIVRIEGANLIREGIKKFGYQRFMKVPQKWLYPLPEDSQPLPEYLGRHRNFILIAEDMNILEKRQNHKQWRKRSTVRHLRALSKMVTTFGLRDSCLARNIPWCEDNKIAFVDTEQSGLWPIKYHPLIEHLSKQNRKYWKRITKNAYKSCIYKNDPNLCN